MTDDTPTLYALDLHDMNDPGRHAVTVLFTATTDRASTVADQLFDVLSELHASDGYTLRALEAVEFFYDMGKTTRKAGQP